MLRKLMLFILILVLNISGSTVYAEEDTNIKDQPTPESPKKDKNNAWIYLASFIALGTTAVYLVEDRIHRQDLKLKIDSVEPNGDGSYIVAFGYENPNNTIAFNDQDYGVRVLKGNAIILKRPQNNRFDRGQHENVFVAVINEDSEIEYYAGTNKISVKGKDIIEKEENVHE